MNEYDVKRLALVLAIQAEGVKATNAQCVFDQEYTMEDFKIKVNYV